MREVGAHPGKGEEAGKELLTGCEGNVTLLVVKGKEFKVHVAGERERESVDTIIHLSVTPA